MRACFLLFIFTFASICGCTTQPEPSILIKRAASPILIDASYEEQSWQVARKTAICDKYGTYGHIYYLWDERYLYLRVKCPLGKVLPKTIKLRLQFKYCEYAAPCDMFITGDGKCLNPNLSRIPSPELPSEVVACKATSNDKNWEAEIRVSLMAIRAIGNRVRLTATITGRRRVFAKGDPPVFTGIIKGLMHFIYPLDRALKPARPNVTRRGH